MNTNSDDILLLKLIKQGDQIAFRHLFYQLLPGLFYLNRRPAENIDDVTLLTLFKKVKK